MRRILFLAAIVGIFCWAQNPPGEYQLDPRGWTDIMPDSSFTGWTRLPFMSATPMDPVSQWKVDPDRKVLLCEGNRGHEWLRYDKVLSDFVLHAEFCFTKIPDGKGYNSGVMVRNSADGAIWIQAQAGQEESGWLFGNLPINGPPQRVNTRNAMTEKRVKPAGEWNTYEIRAVGPRITLWINGGVSTEIPSTEQLKGYLGLEAEGYRVEFRNLKLKELN